MDNNVMTAASGSSGNCDFLAESLSQKIAARQRALDEIDGVSFGWYHIRYIHISTFANSRAIMVAGSGFFTDAYDIFSINLGKT